MSKNKPNSQKPTNKKRVELEKANQRIEELSQEKEQLKQLLLKYQKNDNKNNINEISTSFQNGGAISPENFKSTRQFENMNQRIHTMGEYGSFTTLEKGGIYSNSTLQERIKPPQNYDQNSRNNMNNRNQNDNYEQVILNTEHLKDEVFKIGQSMEEIYKKIEGYERLHELDVTNRKKGSVEIKAKQRLNSQHISHNHNYHHSSHYKNKKHPPKKQYESSDSEDYNHGVNDFSSNSSCDRSACSNNSQDDVYQIKNSFCSNCNQHSSIQKDRNRKNEYRIHEQQYNRELNSGRSNQNKNDRLYEKQGEDHELYLEALNLLKIIQHNPLMKTLFIQKFGSEDLFLETLKKSSKSKNLSLQILKLMVEIINSSYLDFSSQLYSQNGINNNNQNNLQSRSLQNSQVIVSPLNNPKTPSSGFYQQSFNLGSQQMPQSQRQDLQSQYTGENLFKLLEQKVQSPINQNVINTQSSRRDSQVYSNSNNYQTQNNMQIQSNLQLNYLNGSFQQNPFSTDQLSQQNNSFGQGRLGLLNFFPEKPKPQFQAELRDIQNRESLLKMHEYESEIEILEDKLKKIRSRFEDDNRRKEQEEAERLRKQKEDFLRRKAEQEEAENLRKQALELERKSKDQEERDRLQREKDDYEKRIKSLKEDEERMKQEFDLKRREQEEDIRKQREYEDEQNRLRKQREEEDLKRQREYDEEQDRLRKQREKDEEEQQNNLRNQREEDERLRKLREKDESRRRKLQEEEEERKRKESLNHEDNYKVVPDYMKVTKNRCNYVKDVQKEYLKRSNSLVSSTSNTPKSNSATNAAQLNPNWAKALSKFIDKDEQGSEDEASLLNDDSKEVKPKSKFAGDTPKGRNSSQVIKTSDTPKSASGLQKHKNSNINFSSMSAHAYTDVK